MRGRTTQKQSFDSVNYSSVRDLKRTKSKPNCRQDPRKSAKLKSALDLRNDSSQEELSIVPTEREEVDAVKDLNSLTIQKANFSRTSLDRSTTGMLSSRVLSNLAPNESRQEGVLSSACALQSEFSK